MERKRILSIIAPIIAFIVVLAIPHPSNLSFKAWVYLAVFIGVIVGLILEPAPPAYIGLIGIVVAASLKLVGETPKAAAKWALSGFSSTVVWLIFAAFMFALGYQKTGLGRRIALHLIRALGKRTLTLGYAVALSDFILAPFMPSNTARSGGTIYPIIRNIPETYGGKYVRFGEFILWTAFATTCVTSSLFLTGLAPNPLAASFVKSYVGFQPTWSLWVKGFLPAGVILLAIVPLLSYVLTKPEIRVSREIVKLADEQLKTMGPVSVKEKIFLALIALALALWIGGGKYINSSIVALVVVALMVLTGIVSWSDVIGYKQAWNVLVWFATLVALADGLKLVGFIPWLTKELSTRIASYSITTLSILIITVFYWMHYLFASITAQTVAVMPVFLAMIMSIPGINTKAMAMTLAYSLGLFGVLSPYATGPAPIYYGSGYIRGKRFWELGFIFGLVYYAFLILVVYPWCLRVF